MWGGENVLCVKVECVRVSACMCVHMESDWVKNVIVTVCGGCRCE